MTDTQERWTLRQLPFPAKLVITVFLLAVGLGYLSALWQLHMKRSGGGNPLPTVADAVARFSGVPWPLLPKPEPVVDATDGIKAPKVDPLAKAGKQGGVGPTGAAKVAGIKIKSLITERCARCHNPEGEKDDVPLHDFENIAKFILPEPAKSHLRKVIATGNEESWDKENMSRAFTTKSIEDREGEELKWSDQIKGANEAVLRQERDTERQALVAWLDAGAVQATYDANAFPLPPELAKQPLTKRFMTEAVPLVKVEVASNNANGQKSSDPWKKAKAKQISVESLTQSTHAHLLSFAVLWALTGLIFAFTSYPLWVRVILAPTVLLFQVIDISCWWLARLPDIGPYFAIAVMGTGGIVGLGLTLQILLSLFNLYGGKGKAVLVMLFALGAGGLGLLYVKHIEPALVLERQEAQAAQP